MGLKPLFITVFATIFLIISLIKIYDVYHRPSVHHLNPDLQWLGVIKVDNAGPVTSDSILNGENAILVIDHAPLLYQELTQKIPQAKLLTSDELFNLNNLHLFDTNSDGIIMQNDPVFRHLFVIKFYNKGNQNDIKSLSVAGIRGIYINNTAPTGDHLMLMTDGTQRTLIGTSKIEKR